MPEAAPIQVTAYKTLDHRYIRVDNLPFNPQATPKPDGLQDELEKVAPLLTAMLRQHFAHARLAEFSHSAVVVELDAMDLSKACFDAGPFQSIAHQIQSHSHLIRLPESKTLKAMPTTLSFEPSVLALVR